MRILFANTLRPKKAASLISQHFGIKLMKSQEEVAKSVGYRDWHDLAISCGLESKKADHSLDAKNYSMADQLEVISKLVERLECNAGDLAYLLTQSRIFGKSQPRQIDTLGLRIFLFEKYNLPRANKRQPGAVGRFKPDGKKAVETVILREFGSAARVITNKSADSIVADFEFSTPRVPLPLFIPMRLYVPYGKWIEPDGSEVWFSRDYCPLWRFKVGKEPERLDPWQWIKHVDESWFFNESDMPWYKPQMHNVMLEMLEKAGVRGLPRLVEVLPSIIQNNKISNFKNAAEFLKPKESELV